MGSFKMEQPTQVATQETAPVAAALPTPSQGKKSCKTFKKVENLPANRGPRKPCKSILKRKKRTCAPRRKKARRSPGDERRQRSAPRRPPEGGGRGPRGRGRRKSLAGEGEKPRRRRRARRGALPGGGE